MVPDPGVDDLTSDDDDEPIFLVQGGKTRNNGTGYGGASSEDVSLSTDSKESAK